MSSLSSFKNGNYNGDGVLPRNIVGNRGPFAFMPMLNAGVERFAFYASACMQVPVAGDATLTVTNSGTITTVASGLQLVSGATSGNNTTAQWLRSNTPAAGKRMAFACRLQLTNIALGQAFFGFSNAGADPKGTPPTDGFFFSKDTAGTGVIKANIAGNNTLAQSGTVATMVNTTDVEFGGCYTPADTTNGKADFWTRAAGAEGWGAPNKSLTAGAAVGPQAALRFLFNITASSSAALTETVKWFMFAWEL